MWPVDGGDLSDPELRHSGRWNYTQEGHRPGSQTLNLSFRLSTVEVKPEILSSSLMKATFPLAVILSRPDQSGASSFQSAALLNFKERKKNQLWNHKNNTFILAFFYLFVCFGTFTHWVTLNYLGIYAFNIPMQMYSAREFMRPAIDWPSERWTLSHCELLIKTVQQILPAQNKAQSCCRSVTIFASWEAASFWSTCTYLTDSMDTCAKDI